MDDCKSLNDVEKVELEALARYIAVKAHGRGMSICARPDGWCEVMVEVGDVDDEIRFAGVTVGGGSDEARWSEC